MSKEAMKLALEALKYMDGYYMSLPQQGMQAVKALEEALAKQELLFEVDGEMLTASQVAGVALFDFQEATGCNTAEEFKAKQEQGEPEWYHAECDNPDYSGFFKSKADAETQVDEHGGYVINLYTRSQKQEQGEPSFSFQMRLEQGWGSQYPRAQVIGQPDLESLFKKIGDVVTFYTTPQQRTWVGLTEDEIRSVEFDYIRRRDYARAIEAKLKEKNT